MPTLRTAQLRTRLKPSPLALAAAICMAMAAGYAPQAHAQSPATASAAPMAINIPAQPLAQALNELARQANLQMSFPAALVAGKTAPAVTGQLTARAALDRMLAGSGLIASLNATSVVVRPASAAQSGESILPTVTVTANPYTEQLEDQAAVKQRMASTSPKVIVDRAQMAALGDKRVSDVAGRLPGTFAGGPPGEKKSINLRGISSEFARFSFDGINLPSSGGSRNIDLQRISSFIVDDVTYLRSPSAEYEADGMSGRLSIRPRAIPEKAEFEADMGAGGIDKLDGSNRSVKLGYAGRLNERFGLIAAFGQDRFNSIKIKDRSELTFSGGGGPAQNLGFLVDEREPKRNLNTNLYFDLVHYHQGGEVHLKPILFETEVDSTGKVKDQYNRVPGTFRQRSLASGEEDTRTTGVTLEAKHRFDTDVEIDATLSSSRAKSTTTENEVTLKSNLTFDKGEASAGKVNDDLRQAGLNVAIPIKGDIAQRLKFGFLLRDSIQVSDSNLFTVNAAGVQSQTADNLQKSLSADYKVREDYKAAYLQDEIKFGAWTLLPGLRYESVDLVTSGFNANNVKRTLSDVLPSLPVSYRWSPNLVLRGSIAKHVNRPKLGDLAPGFFKRGPRTFIGNPELLPAKSTSIDVGFDYSKDDVFFGMNVFNRNVKDLNEAVEPILNQFVVRNVGDGRIRGLELEQRLRLATLGPDWLKPLSISASQAFLNSRVNDPTTGPRVFVEQPKFIANMTLDYRPAPTGFAASLGISHIGKRTSLTNEGAGQLKNKTIKPQTFVDLRTEWRFSPKLAIYASAENLTNQKRDEFEFVNGAIFRTAVIETGRTFYIGLSSKF